jgi:hypothetical protein
MVTREKTSLGTKWKAARGGGKGGVEGFNPVLPAPIFRTSSALTHFPQQPYKVGTINGPILEKQTEVTRT